MWRVRTLSNLLNRSVEWEKTTTFGQFKCSISFSFSRLFYNSIAEWSEWVQWLVSSMVLLHAVQQLLLVFELFKYISCLIWSRQICANESASNESEKKTMPEIHNLNRMTGMAHAHCTLQYTHTHITHSCGGKKAASTSTMTSLVFFIRSIIFFLFSREEKKNAML